MGNSDTPSTDIIVAGQICLDVLLMFDSETTDLASLVLPGKVKFVDNASISTGGAVANTGLALHQLGISTGLISKIGSDPFGQSILNILEQKGKGLSEKMIIVEHEITACSIVLNAPAIDRSFLYIPGANQTFCADDVRDEHLKDSKIFHLGYPPELRLIFSNQGAEFIRLMKRVKDLGITTSLDMAFPDPDSEAGSVDWYEWLSRGLPYVDLFLPSFDELCFMFEPERYRQMKDNKKSHINLELLSDLGDKALAMGAAMVAIKLGEQGIYFQTTKQLSRLEAMGAGKPSNLNEWLDLSFQAPCYKVDVVGTTGAGDCAVAGILAGLCKDLSPPEVVTMAAAIGAFSVEQADACSGVPHWDKVVKRVTAGWATLE